LPFRRYKVTGRAVEGTTRKAQRTGHAAWGMRLAACGGRHNAQRTKHRAQGATLRGL